MSFEYFIFNSIPDVDVINGILELHIDIFGTSDDLINKMASKPQLLVITAMDGKKVIGIRLDMQLIRINFIVG
ncbi:hypothetical protein [Heyndrickxia oleronia]|uniref:hypothetical protein n=1 Tax=Heyndrickxia oleronia TaxID=38875 RepID=UPI0031453B6C